MAISIRVMKRNMLKPFRQPVFMCSLLMFFFAPAERASDFTLTHHFYAGHPTTFALLIGYVKDNLGLTVIEKKSCNLEFLQEPVAIFGTNLSKFNPSLEIFVSVSTLSMSPPAASG
ncbi:uncharacterized protein BYT42DRAFT_589017 [Radiomyces spectabilis]|uniref:uncharacterized protein n=1 Tax=Radiomyces spectabilis TaxID=64574 RepID=UPI0022205A91|nr:uncharacterized protein BYT42DRAFT_589017 [Radiomyces spectabilis]KAI8366115.1 hypothetical protein BYT42DRAFT_589017 [Radiomyces spectabilis]